MPHLKFPCCFGLILWLWGGSGDSRVTWGSGSMAWWTRRSQARRNQRLCSCFSQSSPLRNLLGIGFPSRISLRKSPGEGIPGPRRQTQPESVICLL